MYDYLASRGWPSSVVGDSGNTYHLVYRIDLPCEDNRLIQKVLAALGDRFDGKATIPKSAHTGYLPQIIVLLPDHSAV